MQNIQYIALESHNAQLRHGCLLPASREENTHQNSHFCENAKHYAEKITLHNQLRE